MRFDNRRTGAVVSRAVGFELPGRRRHASRDDEPARHKTAKGPHEAILQADIMIPATSRLFGRVTDGDEFDLNVLDGAARLARGLSDEYFEIKRIVVCHGG